jgi:hypothetical protein
MNQPGFIRNTIFIILLLVAILIGGLVWFRNKQVPAEGMVSSETYTFECPVPAADDASAILVTMDGIPIMTVDMLEKEYNMLLEKNPQAKMLAQFMPDLKAQFFEGLLASKIVDRCVIERGLTECPEYQQEFSELLQAIRQQLNKKYFGEQIPVTVTSAEARALYEAQKDKAPEILVSQGGVNTQGVEFSDEQQAQDFLNTLVSTKDTLSALAEKENMSDAYRDFKLIHEASLGIDQALKDAVLSLTTFPTSLIIKTGDTYWVISATSQEEKKYRPFAELEEMINETIKKQKQDEQERKQIEALKGEYNIDDSMARAYFAQEAQIQEQAFNTTDYSEDDQSPSNDEQVASATRTA